MWRIKSLTKKDRRNRPMYWSDDVGWTWKENAMLFDEYSKFDLDQIGGTRALAPGKDGMWEKVED